MNNRIPPSKRPAPADADMAEQANPGHGIPSQDPNPAAQTPMPPEEAEREAASVLTAGGVMVGVATGAGIGTVVAGPVGAVVGGTVGAIAGALGGAAAGQLVAPADASEETAKPDKHRATPQR